MIGQTVLYYKVLERLGAGGMGTVYLAEDTRLHRKVAIKFLPEADAANAELKQRFLHEAGAHAKLSHPNIATFLDIQDSEHGPFIVIEYVDGQTLAELAGSRTLAISEILDLAIQTCEGLQAAHAEGVVHRDIKPGNLMVTRDGHIKILDFGLARLRGASKITRTGTQLGTAAYMSPEQAMTHRVDHRSDIFSVGTVLYELVCARHPFEGESEQSILYEVVNEDPQPMARYCKEVPDQLQEAVSKCMAKRPDERYQSAADLAADLRRVKRELESGVTARPTSIRRRRRLPFVLVGVAVILAMLAVYFLDQIEIGFRPDTGAVAAENSLAVMYFDNLTDPMDTDRSADVLTSLLISDLSESEHLRVLSRQRLYDILQQLGHSGSPKVDRATAKEVAAKAGIKYIITGDIVRTKPDLTVTAAITDAESGMNVSAQRVTVAVKDDWFAVVDKLSAEIIDDLELPSEARREVERSVTSITTNSSEAYRHYLRGLDYEYDHYYLQALESYEQAVRVDSTFADAYYRLVSIAGWLRSIEVQEEWMHKAIEYADNASWKVQQFIKALQAEWDTGTQEGGVPLLEAVVERYPDDKEALYKLAQAHFYHYSYYKGQDSLAIASLERLIDLDPVYEPAYDLLASVYERRGDIDKSLMAVNKYIELAPDDPHAHFKLGEILSKNGRLGEAILACENAVEVDSVFREASSTLGFLYLFNRQYDEANVLFLDLASSADQEKRLYGRFGLAIAPQFQGKLELALEAHDRSIGANELDTPHQGNIAWLQMLVAVIHRELGDLPSAISEVRKSLDSPEHSLSSWPLWMGLLAETGQDEKVDSVLTAMVSNESFSRDTSAWFGLFYCWAVGWVKHAQGDLDSAIWYLERACASGWRYEPHSTLARAYMDAGRLGDAARLLEEEITQYTWRRAAWSVWSIQAHYYLGLVYERSGWNRQAIDQYEIFLGYWGNGDSTLVSVQDAKKRLADLKS